MRGEREEREIDSHQPGLSSIIACQREREEREEREGERGRERGEREREERGREREERERGRSYLPHRPTVVFLSSECSVLVVSEVLGLG